MGKKHWIRKIILSAILLTIVVGAIATLNIEPSDYRNSLKEEIATASQLADQAQTGNEAGKYAPQTILLFRQTIDQAKSDVENDTLEYDELKSIFENFRNDVNGFRKAQIHSCLTREEQNRLMEEKGDWSKTVSQEDGSVTWMINGESLKTSAPVNLETGFRSAYSNEIGTLLEKTDSSVAERITLFTLFHDGALPGTFTLSMDFPSGFTGNLQIYRYEPEKNELGPMIRGAEKDGILTFPVTEGGTYLIYAEDADGILLNERLQNPQQEPSDSPPSSESSPNSSQDPSAPDTPSSSDAGRPEPSTPSSAAPPSSPSSVSSSNPQARKTCTIEIRCDTLSSDLSKLTNQAVKPYIPSDGVILAKQKVEIVDGETVFDVLKRITRNKKIQMEFRSTTAYTGGVYIEGIHHLYEFDGGDDSGWMYSVNGWFPNYGAGAYQLKDGDEILWCYTCDLGRDVGGYFG